MNKGITVVAEKVTKLSDHEYELTFDEGQGTTDGGHTQRLLEKNRNDETLPVEQHVEMRVITGVQQPLIADIAKGLNTGMQVEPFAIENLRGSFDWMKEIVDGQPFRDLTPGVKTRTSPTTLSTFYACSNVSTSTTTRTTPHGTRWQPTTRLAKS
jgi:hypothetical protein